MEFTNKFLSRHTGETKTNVDSSFGLYLPKVGGDVTGNLTTDASLIMKGFNDASTFHLTIGVTGDMKVNLYE